MEDTITSGDIAAAASEAATPASASPATHAPATESSAPAATTPAVSTETPQPSTPAKTEEPGPIPYRDHKAVLDRTRQRLEKQIADLEWARKYTPDRIAELEAIAEQHAKMATARQPSPLDHLTLEDGTPLSQVLDPYVDHMVQQARADIRREFEQRLTPMEQRVKAAEAWEQAGEQMAPYLDAPWFNDHIEAITEAIADARTNGERLSLDGAITRVVVPALLAKLEQAEPEARKAVLAELNDTSQQAGDTLNPQRQPAARQRSMDEMTVAEALSHELKRRKIAV